MDVGLSMLVAWHELAFNAGQETLMQFYQVSKTLILLKFTKFHPHEIYPYSNLHKCWNHISVLAFRIPFIRGMWLLSQILVLNGTL